MIYRIGKAILKIISKIVSPGFGFLLLGLTYLPIILVITLSFSESKVATFPLEKFTLSWYKLLLQNQSILTAFKNTLIIGFSTTISSAIISVYTAVLLHHHKIRLSFLYQTLIILPFLLPGIFTGLALLLFFSSIQIPKSLFTVFIGHTVFCSGVIFKTVQSRLAVVSKNLEEASYDLGANTIQTFFYVTLPNIRTAVISGCLMAFVLSFDETLITFFVIGPQMTLPLKIWAMMKASFNPQVHALASIVFITSTLLVLLFSKYILGRETRSGIY